jgi:hypothetical protein
MSDLKLMDSKAAPKPWTEAAETLRDKKELDVCLTIRELASLPASRTAVVKKAVLKVKLPVILAGAIAALLGERKRQRDWRTEEYAANVHHAMAALLAVLDLFSVTPAQQQQPSETAGGLHSASKAAKRSGSSGSSSSTSAGSSSSSSSSGGSSSSAACPLGGASNAAAMQRFAREAGIDFSKPSWESLLRKLAMALQDVAAVLEQASSSDSSSSSSSKQPLELLPLATISLPRKLLSDSSALLFTQPGGLFNSPICAALAEPIAQIGVAALKAAAPSPQNTARVGYMAEVISNI